MWYQILVIMFFVLYYVCRSLYGGRFATEYRFGNHVLYRPVLHTEERMPKSDALFCLIVALLLAYTNGFKRVDVGVDTVSHMWQYTTIGGYDSLLKAISTRNEEYGFVVIMYVLGKLGFSFELYTFTYTFVSMLLISNILSRYSYNLPVSYAIYVLFGLFIGCTMGTVRQGIAMALTFYAFDLIMHNKKYKYLIVMAIAFMFHTSSLAFLPMYWIIKIPYNRNTKVGIIALELLGYIFRGPLMKLAIPFLNEGFGAREAGGQRMYLFYIALLVFTMYIYEIKQIQSKVGLFYLYSLALAVFFLPMASANPAYFRMLYYFTIFFTLLIPYLNKQIEGTSLKVGFNCAYIFVMLYYFVTQIIPYSLYPYYFNWQ